MNRLQNDQVALTVPFYGRHDPGRAKYQVFPVDLREAIAKKLAQKYQFEIPHGAATTEVFSASAIQLICNLSLFLCFRDVAHREC